MADTDMRREIILMVDMNKYIRNKGDLYELFVQNNLVDTVALLNSDIEDDLTYMYGSKQIDYIFTSPGSAEIVRKGGYRQFHQLMIKYHKGMYLHFRVQYLFDSKDFDKIQASYKRL